MMLLWQIPYKKGLKPKRKFARVAGSYAENNLFSDAWVVTDSGEKRYRNLYGQTSPAVIPTYEDLKAEAIKEMEGYGIQINHEERLDNQVMLRIYRAEYFNQKTGITGGRFGCYVYVKDRSGRFWVKTGRDQKVTPATFKSTIMVPYAISRGENCINIPAEYQDYFIHVTCA